jgi:hypothetical protein
LCLDNLHWHSLTLGKHVYASLLDDRDVDENILVTVLGDDEAEPLIGIEPLHRAIHCGRNARVYTIATRWHLWAPAWWLPRASSACVDLENCGHLPTLLTLTDLDAKLGSRSYDIVPGVLQDAKERIARAIPQLNKSEALLFIEPFDSGVDRGTARGRAYARRSS